MSLAILSLIGYATWAVLLGASIVSWRTVLTLSGQSKANEFPSGERHGSESYWRLNRAHANTVENLPIFGALIFGAWAADTITPLVDGFAQWALLLRLSQSIFHVTSGSVPAVLLRVTALLGQYVCFAAIAYLVIFQ